VTERLVSWLLALSPATVYWVIGFSTAVENAFPPTPSDVAVTVGGFLTQQGGVSWLGVWLVACLANLGGSAVVYVLSRRFGRRFIATRVGKRLLPAEALVALEREYLRFGMAGIFLGRLLPGFRSVVAPFAGLVSLPPVTAFAPMIVATSLWYAVLVWAGARVGSRWEAISAFLSHLNRTLAVLAALGIGLITLLAIRRRRRYRHSQDLLLRAVHRALGAAPINEPLGPDIDPAAAGAAALLYELAHADHEITGEERELISSYLRQRWAARRDRTGAAIIPGGPPPRHTGEMATLVAGRYDRERRLDLVRQLYRIATSDGTLGRHEERLMRRAARLLGLSDDDLADARRDRSAGA
jgi:membrane protein DedA with SNARE-associated domain/uncharacterized tellurite resistance protein B-like protein